MNRKIMPSSYFLLILASAIALHFFFPVTSIVKSNFKFIGILILLFAIIIDFWAFLLFRKKRTVIKAHQKPLYLVISGPFKISRHPMYLGMAIALLGTSVIMGSLTPFITPFLFLAVMNKKFVSEEEKVLEKDFGEKYRAYKRKVRKWI
ncbi:MAG: isoprenylcysteine carboxylmethyltransferase family protein [bacterium]|nr:isoprenylcysteine carboxylmethyltransferase family protein [bacterium]